MLEFSIYNFLNNIISTLGTYKMEILGILILFELILIGNSFFGRIIKFCMFNIDRVAHRLYRKISFNYYTYTIFFIGKYGKLLLLLLIGSMIITIFQESVNYILLPGWVAFSGIVIGFLYNKENSRYQDQKNSLIITHKIVTYLLQLNKLENENHILNHWVIKNLLKFQMIQNYDILIAIVYSLSISKDKKIDFCRSTISHEDVFNENNDVINEKLLSKLCFYFDNYDYSSLNDYNYGFFSCKIDNGYCCLLTRTDRDIRLKKCGSMEKTANDTYSYNDTIKKCISYKLYNNTLKKFVCNNNTYETQLLLKKITNESYNFYEKRHFYHIPNYIRKYMKYQFTNKQGNLKEFLEEIEYYLGLM